MAEHNDGQPCECDECGVPFDARNSAHRAELHMAINQPVGPERVAFFDQAEWDDITSALLSYIEDLENAR